MKKIILYILSIFLVFYTNIVSAVTIKEWLIWNTEDATSTVSDISSNDWIKMLQTLLQWAKNEITSIIWILSVWIFIFIWIRIMMARWNPDEFKKAILHFVYAVIWVFIVFMAWWLVKLVSTLSL